MERSDLEKSNSLTTNENQNNEIVNTNNSQVVSQKNISDEELLKMFFEKNELSELVPKFIEQKVFTPELIKDLTDEDLEKLGVSLLGDRKNILKLFSSGEFDLFKSQILYKDLTSAEKEKLDIPENRILKQNTFNFSYASGEEGTLTLYENRIVWKGYNNHFIIPINKIKDVSIENSAAQSILKITDDLRTYSFFMVNKKSATLAGVSMFNNNLEFLGLAMMNDKPMSDTEYWRYLIEKLRERNPIYEGDRGQPIQVSDTRGMGCIVGIIIVAIVIICLVCGLQ